MKINFKSRQWFALGVPLLSRHFHTRILKTRLKNTAFSGQGRGRNGTDGLMFSAEAFQQQNRQFRR